MTLDPDVSMMELPLPEVILLVCYVLCPAPVTNNSSQTMEMEFISRLHSLAVEGNQSVEPPEPTPSLQQNTHVCRLMWKVWESQLTEVPQQGPPFIFPTYDLTIYESHDIRTTRL